MAEKNPQGTNGYAQQLDEARNLDRGAARSERRETQGSIRRGASMLGLNTRARGKGLAPARPTGEERGSDPNYPYPISTMRLMAFILMALALDGLQLLLTFFMLDWVASFIGGSIFLAFYFYMILYRAPKPLRGKMLMRSGLFSSFEMVPVVGGIMPTWTGVAIMAYKMIRGYETGKGDGLLGKLTDKAIDKAIMAVAPEVAAIKKGAEKVEKKFTSSSTG